MIRGDVVTVAAPGDYGMPRPAVIVQSDALPETHASVVVCQMTSEIIDAPFLRVTVEPSPDNGLRSLSQIMADKPISISRKRVGHPIGRLAEEDIRQLNASLAFVLGLAD